MSHVLLTVLLSLTLPAIAFAAIFAMERAGKKHSEEAPQSLPERSSLPAVDPAVELPVYRERAG
jgi:hypothetical protein